MYAIHLKQSGLFHPAQQVCAQEALNVLLSNLVDYRVVVKIGLWWGKNLIADR
jgi:hypothetical protein